MLCDSLQASDLLLRLAPLGNIPQQQRVSREPLQGRHQQVAQLQSPALLVPLTPLNVWGDAVRESERRKNRGEGQRGWEPVMVFVRTDKHTAAGQ